MSGEGTQNLQRARRVGGKAWIGSENSADYWAEGVDCQVEIERDDTEIRVGIMLQGSSGLSAWEDAGLYLTEMQALRLAKALEDALLDG